MLLECREIFKTADNQSLFDSDVHGFREDWWGFDEPLVSCRSDAFSFFDGSGEEVARAKIDPSFWLRGSYDDLHPIGPMVKVNLFEVRHDGHRFRRCNGVGLEAADLLINSYPGRDMLAFSEADRFWTKAGWTPFNRVDGGEGYQTLFVHLNR